MWCVLRQLEIGLSYTPPTDAGCGHLSLLSQFTQFASCLWITLGMQAPKQSANNAIAQHSTACLAALWA